MSSQSDRLRLRVRVHEGSPAPPHRRIVQMLDIKPCLWFVAEAEEAANYYVSVFPDSRIAGVMRGAPGSPAIAVDFVLDGKPFLALNGRREPGFTDAHSFVVTCETQA